MKCKILLGFIVMGLIVTGCGETERSKTEIGLSGVPMPVPEGECVSAGCVATFFNPDGSRYITTQQHRIYLTDQRIIVSSTEPAGDFVCQFSRDGFNVTSSLGGGGGMATQILHSDTTQLVLAAFSVGSGFLDGLTELGEPKKISGQLYQPLQSQLYCQGQVCLTFYRNINSGVIDVVRFEDSNSAKYLFCRSFNYQKISGLARPVPTKIDIFDTDKAGLLGQQLLQLKYFDVKKLQFVPQIEKHTKRGD
jgi:hypothetical protein